MRRRSLPRWFVGGLLRPGWKRLRRDPEETLRRQLEQYERWDPADRERVRAERLATLLEAARREVPVWRERIPATARIAPSSAFELLRDLPTTDKATYRAWGEKAYAEAESRGWIASSTGGSTGEPFWFRCDRAAAPWRRANTARSLGWLGIEPGDPSAVLWGFALGARRLDSVRTGARNVLSNQLTLSSFAMDPRTLDRHLDRLAAFRPRLFVGYPSALTVLAEHARRAGRPLSGLRVALSSGESLFDPQREAIEAGFGAPLFERYGSREFANVAHHCAERSGLHVCDDLLEVEILDAEGRPCPAGTLGELVITDLHNLAMPFLRYRTGDLAEWAEGPCPCGRPLPRLGRVEGRAFDVVVTPSGARVGGYFWTWLSRAVDGIAAFQVQQESRAGVRLLVVPGSGWEPGARRVLEDHVRGTCGEDFAVEIHEVTEIPLTPSGKRRFILSDLENRP